MIETPTLIKTSQTGLGYSFMMSQLNNSILSEDIGHALCLHPPHLVSALACIMPCCESTHQPVIDQIQKKKR